MYTIAYRPTFTQYYAQGKFFGEFANLRGVIPRLNSFRINKADKIWIKMPRKCN